MGQRYMGEKGGTLTAIALSTALGAALILSACGQGDQRQEGEQKAPAAGKAATSSSIPMGGAKSVTRFFITSKGLGKGGDLGGLAGADAHCQMLAEAQGSGDHTWHAYLSTQATAATPAVNARDRIGGGPWYNADGDLIAQNLTQLHGAMNKLAKDTAVTESAEEVSVDQHAILTGSRPDGTAFPPGSDRTCANWTSSSAGSAHVGYSDRAGEGENPESWNSSHGTNGCNEDALHSSGGAGLFYCFGTN
jgi:hypothetical protein